MPVALFSAEKFVTAQTQEITKRDKQTVNDISTSCLSACVDNNFERRSERREWDSLRIQLSTQLSGIQNMFNLTAILDKSSVVP